jgi:hypothetical protein
MAADSLYRQITSGPPEPRAFPDISSRNTNTVLQTDHLFRMI